jgi:hypothetical protein
MTGGKIVSRSTVPVPVRYQLAFDAALTRAVLRVFPAHRVRLAARRAARRGLVGARSGSVTAIQRFGGAANLNVHFLAGLRRRLHADDPDRPTTLSPAAAAHRCGHRAAAHPAPPPRTTTPDPPRARGRTRPPGTTRSRRTSPCSPARWRSLQGRVARGPRAGQPLRRLRSAAAATATGRRSARLEPAGAGPLRPRSGPGTGRPRDRSRRRTPLLRAPRGHGGSARRRD